MKDKVATILRIFLSVLLVVSAVLFIIFYSSGEDFTNAVLTWAYILLAFTALITLVFPIVYLAMNPKNGKSIFIGILGFVVLYLIAYYGMASGSITGEVYETFKITEGTSRFIGAILNMTYILGGLAILSIIYSGISSLINK
jgi:hypothetical protein